MGWSNIPAGSIYSLPLLYYNLQFYDHTMVNEHNVITSAEVLIQYNYTETLKQLNSEYSILILFQRPRRPMKPS